jgi:hypothetical protein
LIAISDVTARIKAAIADMILNLPDNPRITRINERCFSLTSRELNGNWTPFYHDFKEQGEFIAGAIQKMEDKLVIPFLRRIVYNQSAYYKSKWYKFHPVFCNHLKTLIETYGVE